MDVRPGISIITHGQQFCQDFLRKFFFIYFSQKCWQIQSDLLYYNCPKGEGLAAKRQDEKTWKKFEKGLDNPLPVWYN